MESKKIPIHRLALVIEPAIIFILGTSLWLFMLVHYGLKMPQSLPQSFMPLSHALSGSWPGIMLSFPIVMLGLLFINIYNPLASQYTMTTSGIIVIRGRWFGRQKPFEVRWNEIVGVAMQEASIRFIDIADIELQCQSFSVILPAVRRPQAVVEEIRSKLVRNEEPS